MSHHVIPDAACNPAQHIGSTPIQQALASAGPQGDPKSPFTSPPQSSSHNGYSSPEPPASSVTSPQIPWSPTLVPAPLRSATRTTFAPEVPLAPAFLGTGSNKTEQAIRRTAEEQAQRAPSTKTTPAAPASPTTPVSMVPPRLGAKAISNRTVSLDSTVSSAASKPAQAMPPHSAVDEAIDIPALIAAAGSPEAAIQKLIQQKESASTHNAQLWRLVEKQRAMILGLNKDLERSMKDKERYRKRFKDNLIQSASMPVLAGMTQGANAMSEPDETPAFAGPADDLSATHGTEIRNRDGVLPTNRQTPTRQQGSSLPSSSPYQVANHADSSQEHQRGAATRSSPLSSRPSRTLMVSIPLGANSPELAQSGSDPPTRSPPQRPETPQSFVESSPLLGSTTPLSARHGFSSPQDRRRAPPAPLDLSQEASARQVMLGDVQTSSTLDHENTSALDNENASVLTPLDRGRRQIREYDGLGVSQEQEDANTSVVTDTSQGPSAESNGASQHDFPGPDEDSLDRVDSRCASPEEPGSPHLAQMQTYHSLGSLASMLQASSETQNTLDPRRTLLTTTLISPGLPKSPRPVDRPVDAAMPRAPRSDIVSLPVSPRTGGMPLSPRAPRQAIPLPPQTPPALTSPHLAQPEVFRQQSEQAAVTDMLMRTPPRRQEQSHAVNTPLSPGAMYRGFVSEQYPGLLLPPNALPLIHIKVDSSRLRPSRHSNPVSKQADETPVFTLAVHARSDDTQLWRVEKTLAALAMLDQQVKTASRFQASVPDRGLFTGHAPAKIDARRSALGLYFEAMLDTPLDDQGSTIICAFFSSDAISADVTEYFQPQYESAPLSPKVRTRMEGYLTKRGKNFGGWKARYFVLDGPILKYFETPGGAQLGSIKLQRAQVGKQPQQFLQHEDEDDDHQYRHAFVILEPKRKDSSSLVRHVLCAESDEERNAWVESLTQHTEQKQSEESHARAAQPLFQGSAGPRSPRSQKSQNDLSRPSSRSTVDSLPMGGQLRAVSYGETVAAEAPTFMHASGQATHSSPPPLAALDAGQQAAIDQIGMLSPPFSVMGESWAKTAAVPPAKEKDRKKGLFGFRGRANPDAETILSASSRSSAPCRPVFGVPLAEAAEFCAPTDVSIYLPAVVYRSIEYLRAKGATSEEGIFRLSGSNIVIKALRERFNIEGDVKLLADGQYYDVHAVASLLKLFLRELPASILTRDLHFDFLKCMDMEGPQKVEMCNVLVNKLPRANRELLEQLAAFLREIVDNERVNKMTVRNVGIVFSPTLNIPAPLISLFVTDYTTIFGPSTDISAFPGSTSNPAAAPQPMDEIHSPRKQMFSDLPTPSYNQTSFQQQIPRSPLNTGFIPMHQTYAQPAEITIPPSQKSMAANGLLGVPGLSKEQRLARRESGNVQLNVGLLNGGQVQRPGDGQEAGKMTLQQLNEQHMMRF